MRFPPMIIAATALALGLVGTGVGRDAETRAGGSALPRVVDSREARSDFGMVAAGSSESAAVGIAILENGGNAIDAAIATTFAQSVADADALGLGGMTYMVIHFADGRSTFIDGTPRAPAAVDLERLQRLRDADRTKGYELVAAPTTLAVLELARSRYGSMAMADLIEPAIELTETGYRLSELQIYWSNKYLDDILSSDYLSLMMLEDARRIGAPGTVYCRPDLARTLRRIAEEGVMSFYRGSLAAEMAADMAANGGFVQRTDLATVRVQERPPLATRYRGLEVLTVPAPGGGPVLVDILETLDGFSSSFLAGNTVERHHVLIEAFRLARAGAASSNAGPPGSGRGTGWIRPVITPGRMIAKEELGPEPDPACSGRDGESTTHIAVVDRWGNVVSMTSTLGRSFGACVATPGLGFPYNGFLETFDYSRPHCPGYLRPHAPCPTTMAPTIVIADGMPTIALGSPGSNRIASILADVIVNVVDRGMGLEEAVEAPRIVWGGENGVNQVHIEIREPLTEELVEGLEGIGFDDILRIEFPEMDKYVVLVGGVNAVAWDERASTFVEVGDRRRTGFAGGPRVVADRHRSSKR